MTQFVGMESVPTQRNYEANNEDLELKAYLGRFAPYVEAYVETNNLDIDAKVEAYRELINDYQLIKSDLDELRTNPTIQSFISQKPDAEKPAHATLEDELEFYLTVSGSDELAQFKLEQANAAAEADYLRSRAERKARLDEKLNRLSSNVKNPDVTPVKLVEKVEPKAEVEPVEVTQIETEVAPTPEITPEVDRPAEPDAIVPQAQKTLKSLTDVKNRAIKYAVDNRTKSIATGAAALSLVGMLATLPTKDSAEEKGRMIANSVSGREVFLMDEKGPVVEATINELVSVENTENSVDAAHRLKEFVQAAQDSVKNKPSITVAKPDAKLSVEFLEIFADETAKESVNLALPLAVQNSVQANAELLKVIAHHPAALKKEVLSAIAEPENEFQTELTGFLGTEGIIQNPAVYNEDQQAAILGAIARIYDLSNDEKREKIILNDAKANAKDNMTDLQGEQSEAGTSSQTGEPDLPNNGRLSGEALQAAEANAAAKAYANRVKDLANQFKDDMWSAGRPVKPLDADTLTKIILDTHARYNHDIFGPKAALAQLAQESKFDVNAGSHAGAQGIAQFMPGTWPQWSNGKDVNDPVAAIDAQFRFMIALCKLMENRFPDRSSSQILKLALAGYNAGPNNDAVEAGRIPQNGETNVYVDKISGMMSRTTEWIDAAVREVQELNMVVPEGARDLGIHKGYTDGLPVNLHLVAIPGMKSSSDESNKKNKYYVEGSNGEAIVNIRIAAQLLELQKAAEEDGIDLSLVSSYRTHEHQKALWKVNPNRAVVAEPGHSNHQQGLAVDFDLDGLPITAGYYNTEQGGDVTAENPRVAPESKTWKWLKDNADKFGFIQYYNEPWHWSLSGH